MKKRMLRIILPCAVLLPFLSFSQTDFSDKLTEWKKLFPKEDAIAYSHKQVVDFTLNKEPKPGEGKVKATVHNEVVIVPVKDYMKYDDALFYNDELSVDNLKVLNTEGKEVRPEKQCMPYQEESIFHSDLKVCIIKFGLTDKGKPFKLSYQNNYRDVKYLTSFYFNDNLPAIERIVQFNIPSWLELDLREFNFTGKGVEKTSVAEGGLTKVTFKYKDVPAYVREPSSPNHAITYPHVVVVAKGFSEGGSRTALFESVKDLYGWYSSVCSDIGNKPDELKAQVAELTAKKTTDIEKIESLFYWVQDNIRYIAFEEGIMGFRPDAAQNVLQKKYGDCKGKANLLKEMLKLAGYDARLTWIGTSDLPYDYSLPSLCVDNHMICTVILNGKKYYLDGTEDFIALNDYAQRIQGKQVLIEDGKNYIIEKVPEFAAERNKEKKLFKLAVNAAQLLGTASVEYAGESKINVQRAFTAIRNDNRDESLVRFLKSGDDNISISNVKTSDFADRQKALQLQFDIKAAHQVTTAGNELYIVMDWEKEFADAEIAADRKNDFEFSQKYYLTTQSELQIPEGYKVDYLPAAFKKSTPHYSFEGGYVQKGNTVVYSKTIAVHKPILKKSDFPAWNAFIADINKFYNDQLVLKK